jgi:hypothetical protein
VVNIRFCQSKKRYLLRQVSLIDNSMTKSNLIFGPCQIKVYQFNSHDFSLLIETETVCQNVEVEFSLVHLSARIWQ